MVDIELVRSKIARMKHSLNRLKGKYSLTWTQFRDDIDVQDIVSHNLQLAIQICINISSHIIADEDWEVPTSFGNTFRILSNHKVISPEMADIMASMAGFRNVLIHEYEDVDLKKVYEILTNRLSDFEDFSRQIIKYLRI